MEVVSGPDSKRFRHHYDTSLPIQHHNSVSQPLETQPMSFDQGFPTTHRPMTQPLRTGFPIAGSGHIFPQPPTPASAGPSPPHPSTVLSHSTYHDTSHDTRNLPDPAGHAPTNPSSGQTTPRDARFASDVDYSRRNSAPMSSTTPRSPNDQSQFPPHPPPLPVSRPLGVIVPPDGASYPQSYILDSVTPVHHFPPADTHTSVNGHVPHVLSVPPHDPAIGPPMSGYGPDYGQSSGMPPYGGMPFGPGAALRKKGNRATQACDVCRTRKAKCDEGRPRCTFCVENEMPCHYQSVAPAKADRVSQGILDGLDALSKEMQSMREGLQTQMSDASDGIVSILEKFLSNSGDHKELKVMLSHTGQASPAPKRVLMPNGVNTASSSQGQKTLSPSPNSSFHTSSTEPSSQHVPTAIAKQNAMYTEHDVAAQKLFRWPSIRALLQKCKDLDFSTDSENYVMRMELQRGPLRKFGAGQGSESVDQTSQAAIGSSPASMMSPYEESIMDASHAEPLPELLWGHGFSPFVGEGRSDATESGLQSDNTLKLDSKTIDSLHASYMRDIHILHPILNEAWLRRVLNRFKQRYGTITPLSATNAGFAVPITNANADALRDGSGATFTRPMKRKHSDGQYWPDGTSSVPSLARRVMLEKSPVNALILLVLALGKIATCRQALPAIPSVYGSTKTGKATNSLHQNIAHDSPPITAGILRSSPASSPYASSPTNITRTNHGSPFSTQGGFGAQQTNLDIIPGFAYYAQATDILGGLMGSHDLLYVQCCILAGLYAGQLANTVESLSWIQAAARGCCVLARGYSSIGDRALVPFDLRVAFHTALQLEGDILAEIDWPSSGIRKINWIEYPPGDSPDIAPADLAQRRHTMKFYSYQLNLRNLLDTTQADVYSPGKNLSVVAQNKTLRVILMEWLQDWRSKLPPDMKWNDGDLASDILTARLRGKYYGALYIIHRPMLHLALDMEANGKWDALLPSSQQSDGQMPPPKLRADDFTQEIIDAATTTIKAAVWSTVAFDAVIDTRRLVVTNIFGTSHAQFGNMLVLSAAYSSPMFRQYISADPRATMEHLFKRTMNLLKDLAKISPTLGHDWKILNNLKAVVLDDEDATSREPSIKRSFDS